MLDRRIATALFPPFRPITVLEDKIMVGRKVKLDETLSVRVEKLETCLSLSVTQC